MKSQKAITVLGVTLVFLLVVIMIFQFVTMSVSSKKQNDLKAEIAEMEKSIATITDEISYRETLLYIEKYARENLDLFAEGDVIFVPNS